MKYKKILATIGSFALVGATVAGAFAAAYPANMNADNTVVVQGTGAGAEDSVALNLIDSDLAGPATSGAIVVGGQSVELKSAGQEFNLGMSVLDAFGNRAVTKTHMAELLADGTYTDDDREDHRYTQRLNLGNNTLEFFSDWDYQDDEPSIGFSLDDDTVLNYTVSFLKAPNLTNEVMHDTELTMLGKVYYVFETSDNSITLLNDADQVTVTPEGETVTVDGKSYQIEIDRISAAGTPSVRLRVNGEETRTLEKSDSYELSDGAQLVVRDIWYADRDRDTDQVDITIGSGKLELRNDQEIRINDNRVRGVKSHLGLTGGDSLQSITIEWNADGKEFVGVGESITMPGLGVLSFTFTEFNEAAKEQIQVRNDGRESLRLVAPIADGNAEINFLYANTSSGNFKGIGNRDGRDLLVTSDQDSITFDRDNRDRWFVVSKEITNFEAESYLLTITDIDEDEGEVRIENVVTGEYEVVANETSYSPGSDITLTVTIVDDDEVLIESNGASFNTLYTNEGLKVSLPWVHNFTTQEVNFTFGPIAANNTGTYYADSWQMTFQEADKDGRIGQGSTFGLVLGTNSDNYTQVANVANSDANFELGDSGDYEHRIYSELATKILHRTDRDQNIATVTYNGEEAVAKVYVSSEVSSQPGEAGSLIVTDTEAATITDKNLIVVGGSAINSIAASLLDVSYPSAGEAFTDATGVGAGQYLVQSFAHEGNVAVLVAGYNQADTENAANYLVNQRPDIASGMKYVGSTATQASSVVN